MSEIWSALGSFGVIWAAIAASLAAYFTYHLMTSGQEQVKIGQQQFAQSVKAQQDALLPVLIPADKLDMVANTFNDEQAENLMYVHLEAYISGMPWARVRLKNAGQGIAFNVRGVLFEPEPEKAMDKIAGRLHGYYSFPLPIEPGQPLPDLKWGRGGPPITGDTEIGDEIKYKMYAPKRSTRDLATVERDARLTLTYSDVFGRKHAAIFDHTVLKTWELVDYLPDIKEDLRDIERVALRTLPNGAPRISVEDFPGILPSLS